MTRFLIYLLESGIILTLTYLGYVVLFRKETYFNFIRIYLILSIILALSIPIVHLNLDFNKNKYLKRQVEQINQFKSFYEKLAYWTEIEYVYDGPTSNAGNYKSQKTGISSAITTENTLTTSQKIILFTYLSGLGFFLIRFIYLLFWLHTYSKKNTLEYIDGLKLIHLNDDIPSFSFFNRIYINCKALSTENFKKVFAHEKIHVKQKHSLDLLLAHIMTIFQWFNPLVWRLHKSMKIVHEYIADRKVVEQGYELFDYQSLLLSQLIGIRSVELVNNFNLLSIKKRIAMMNKMKSGTVARLKAFLALPIIIAVFFVFANMTINENKDEARPLVSSVPNSFVSKALERPVAEFYQEVSLSDMNFQIAYDGKHLILNNKEYTLGDFSDVLEKKINSLKKMPDYFQVSLDIDVNVKMKDISTIFLCLRQNNILKLAFLVDPAPGENIENKTYAQLQKLPPIDAEKLDKDEIRKQGFEIMEFDEKIPVGKVMSDIESALHSKVEYILEYTYYPNTHYDIFMKYCNSVRVVYQKVRNEYALKNYSKDFDELDKETRNVVMSKYPIRLTMQSPDNEI